MEKDYFKDERKEIIMIGTRFLKGQGLGNQLFCYVSTRCIALDNGCAFGSAGQEEFANNIHSHEGMYFMNIELGGELERTDVEYKYIYENEERILMPTSKHDRTIGCYVSGADPKLMESIPDDTIIYGNLQSEKYFLKHKAEIKEWLAIRPEFINLKYSKDDLCILNMRGGEYVGNNELYLRKKYWVNAMNYMRHLVPDMNFIIITEDVKAAKAMFPDMEAYHLGVGEDYAVLHFAKYLILSNSSFAFWPVFTSDNAKFIIAPKYWARHNYSDGYWASEQNIYTGWNYMDRRGSVYSAEECRAELSEYKKLNWEKLNYPNRNFIWSIKIVVYDVRQLLYRIVRKAKRQVFLKNAKNENN